MNKVFLIGGLVRDPETKVTQTGLAVTRFTVGVSRGKDKGSDYISCVAFDKTSSLIQQYCAKGSKVAIEGSIQTGSYKDKNDKTVYTTDIIVNRIEFLDGKKPDKPAPVADEPDDLPSWLK